MLFAYVLAPGFIEAASFPKSDVFSEIDIFGPKPGIVLKKNESVFIVFWSGPRLIPNHVNKLDEFRDGGIRFFHAVNNNDCDCADYGS
jgi:hypothetical protein